MSALDRNLDVPRKEKPMSFHATTRPKALNPWLTNAQCRWHAQAQQVLVQQEQCEEQTVIGPEVGDGLTAPACQDGHQPAAMYNHHEVHALPDHIHGHQEADLEGIQGMDIMVGRDF